MKETRGIKYLICFDHMNVLFFIKYVASYYFDISSVFTCMCVSVYGNAVHGLKILDSDDYMKKSGIIKFKMLHLCEKDTYICIYQERI